MSELPIAGSDYLACLPGRKQKTQSRISSLTQSNKEGYRPRALAAQ